jgi:hypothetical protein
VEVFTPSAQQSSLANKMQFFPPTILYDKISATGLTKNITVNYLGGGPVIKV